MEVPHGEGVACHTGPAPCVADREVGGEALARGDVGWVLSRGAPGDRQEVEGESPLR
jgi:hypothetical protein